MRHHHEELNAIEAIPCKRTAEFDSSLAAAIEKDKSRQTKTILLVMPDDVVVSTDMLSLNPRTPEEDLEAVLRLRQLSTSDDTEEGTLQQKHYPGFWDLRIVNNVKTITTAKKEVKTIAGAFQGMKPKEGDKEGVA